MADRAQEMHVVLFPFMAHGHMIPILDMAKLFASRGVNSTIITTPSNAPFFAGAPPTINIEVFQFPSVENGLPDGCESITDAIKVGANYDNFTKAVDMLSEQLEQYLDGVRPHCLVADMFLPWSTEIASKFNVPRLVFHGTCYFALCADEIIRLHQPFKGVSSHDHHPPCVLPFLPHEIRFTRLQIADYFLKQEEETEFRKLINLVRETEVNSFGVIVNSFYELEPDYSEFYTANLGRRSWRVGPLSLCNRSLEDKTRRGQAQVYSGKTTLLEWLDLKRQDSVIYVCTGSLANFTRAQLHEVAMGLEASQQDFIWVVKTDDDIDLGFEQRMQGKGLIIRGWAPQLLILEHEATGAFLTHCGWNSTLEGISAGVPMVTWPGAADQFYIEKLVTQILNIGVPIGAKKWSIVPYAADYLVKGEMIEKALREIMKGDEAQERRARANKLKEMALKAVGENGSSYSDLGPQVPGSLKLVLYQDTNTWGEGGNPQHNVGVSRDLRYDQDSVIYVCTGSIANFTRAQLHEVAMGLEASQQDFIWVVKTDDDDMKCLLPGFEHRMEGKGLIVRGWAPQMLILEHKATGVFVTHCGWNSILEGISTGVPMVTWPGGSEQFYIETLVIQILNIGVSVGAKKWSLVPYANDYLVKEEMIENVLREIMKGDGAQERRARANKLKEMALKAVEENGSSYSDLCDLINELRHYHATL